jgi:hypothetical protein
MRVWIEHSQEDVQRVRALVALPELQARIAQRRHDWIEDPGQLNHEAIWTAMIACLVTSQQKSGPGSKVEQFLQLDPLPINLATCRHHAGDVAAFVTAQISAAGLRRGASIGASCAANLTSLDAGQFDRSIEALCELMRDPTLQNERLTARYFHGRDGIHGLHGVGPKQSRNFLLNLGLMRHELPLDSRITRWMRENLSEAGSQLVLSPAALGDEDYYSFIVDAVQRLCQDADVLPSDFDAAAFYLEE